MVWTEMITWEDGLQVKVMLKDSLACYWLPKGKWIRAHGDYKAASGGAIQTNTMTTSTNIPALRVGIKFGGAFVVGPFEMPGCDRGPPRNEEVARDLKNFLHI